MEKERVFSLCTSLPPLAYRILYYVLENYPVTSKDVAEDHSISPSTASRILSILVERGFLARESVKNDMIGRPRYLYRPASGIADVITSLRKSCIDYVSSTFDELIKMLDKQRTE